MATLYYNNAEADGDLDNVLNWWTDSGWSTPAGRVPEAGDDAELTGDINSGTLTCDTAIYVPGAGAFNDGTFNCLLDFNNVEAWVNGGTFNGQVNANNVHIIGGSFYGYLVDPYELEGSNGVNIYGQARFIDFITITSAVCWEDSDIECVGDLQMYGNIEFRGKVSFPSLTYWNSAVQTTFVLFIDGAFSWDDGATYWWHSSRMAAAADVRSGVLNGDTPGELVVSSGGSGGGVIKMGR